MRIKGDTMTTFQKLVSQFDEAKFKKISEQAKLFESDSVDEASEKLLGNLSDNDKYKVIATQFILFRNMSNE